MKTQQKRTKRQIERLAKKLLSCRTLSDVEQLLRLKSNTLALHAFEPLYYHFTLPKSDGSKRYIEAPDDALKQVQRKLNMYLQCVYYMIQTAACHGFMISAIAEKQPKNIYTNAVKHLKSRYLINVDMEDFFHQIKMEDVQLILNQRPFNLNKHAARIIAKLCTYKGRLPMGTPTSPVLSNFYAIQPDQALQKWANQNQVVYTRFVDDLTFSSSQTILNPDHITTISDVLKEFNLKLNSEKQKFYGPEDCKKVTGLLVGDIVEIDAAFYSELEEDLLRLKKIIEVNQITGNTGGLAFLRKFKQEVAGKINFIKQIMGKNSREYAEYINSFYDALEPKDQFVARWTKFNNYA